MDQLPANWRVSVKALIRDEAGRILLVNEGDPWWGLPGGGLDHGESILDALRRELREEIGAEVAGVEPTPSFVWTAVAEGDNPENKPGRKYKLWLVYQTKLAGLPQPIPNMQLKWFTPDEITPSTMADYLALVYDEFIGYLKSVPKIA